MQDSHHILLFKTMFSIPIPTQIAPRIFSDPDVKRNNLYILSSDVLILAQKTNLVPGSLSILRLKSKLEHCQKNKNAFKMCLLYYHNLMND